MYNGIRPADYTARLHNTVVCYRGFPVLLSVLGSSEFQISPVHKKSQLQPQIIKPNDPLLDISTPPLGWFDYNDPNGYRCAHYIERVPTRQFHQGLIAGNIRLYYLSGNKILGGLDRHAHMSKGYEDLVLGNYQEVGKNLERLKIPDVLSVALSRNIAVSKKEEKLYSVFYKREEAGYIIPGKNVVKVPNERFSAIIIRFLKEIPWEVD
jgi:hypothetical protein